MWCRESTNRHTAPPGIHPGDHVQLTWLDERGAPTDADEFTVTSEFDANQDNELRIHSPLGERLAGAHDGETVNFHDAGHLVAVRIDSHHSTGDPT